MLGHVYLSHRAAFVLLMTLGHQPQGPLVSTFHLGHTIRASDLVSGLVREDGEEHNPRTLVPREVAEIWVLVQFFRRVWQIAVRLLSPMRGVVEYAS